MKASAFVFLAVCLVSMAFAKSSFKPTTINRKLTGTLPLRSPQKYFYDQGLNYHRKDRISTQAAAVVAESEPSTKPKTEVATGSPNILKLLIGAGGIYSAFLYYGALQEDVFHYTAADGSKFTAAWFLQAVEALANVLFGLAGLAATGFTPNLPQNLFGFSGVAQVSAKAFTSLALANGVSFPIVTLAKSGKMVPVMLGSLLLGGAKYSLRQYLSVAAIIAGTVLVSLGNKSKPGQASSVLGLAFIIASLACDGITGGVQKRLKTSTRELGVKPKPADFMFWTNLYMAVTAGVIALFFGEVSSGIQFCLKNPIIFSKLLKFALCSAVGQSFIFYTISEFDPLVCSTVTTTRKVFSVLLSILMHGHAMSMQGWAGISLAFAGILSELFEKKGGH